MHSLLLPLGGGLTVLLLLKQLFDARRRKFLPPGPPGLPFLGNTFSWPVNEPWVTFTEWAKAYGDIVYAKAGPNEMLIVNSYATATALLQSKSGRYSDRPSQHFVGNMIGWGPGVVMLPDGAELQQQRRMLLNVIGTHKSVETFEARIEKYIAKFVKLLLESSEPDIPALGRQLTGAIILDVTFGYKVSEKGDDALLGLGTQVIEDFGSAVAPGAHLLVDIFPSIERLPSWLPGMGFKEEAKRMRKRYMKFVYEPYAFAKSQLHTEAVPPSMVTNHFSNKDLTADEEWSLMWAAAGMYSGGSDTTASAFTTFVYSMLQFPHVQARAQAELDALLGGARLPTARDMDALPYVRALVSEVLRFGLVVPQAIPHFVREDDEYEGYLIPKGSTIIPNVHFMSRDTRSYTDPETFNPERFLGDDPELDPRKYTFGFGKRACPGRVFAETNIFLTIATCLSTVTFLKAKDQEGKDIEPRKDWEGVMATHLKRFPCRVLTRSEQTIILLQSADV